MKDVLLRNAFSEHQRGNLGEAARLYAEILRTNPRHSDALCMLGLVHMQRGELAEANGAADEAMRHSAGTSLYNLGCLLQNLDRHDDALSCFDKVLGTNPSSFEALIHRGLSLLALNDPSTALASFDRALALRPREAGVWHNRANALLSLNRREEAVASYERALALNPAFGEAWINRGRALTLIENYEEALASYERAIALKPNDLGLWNLRGATLIVLKRFPDAVANFDGVLTAYPDDIVALLNRGFACDQLHRHAEALANFDKVLQIDPRHAGALFHRGSTLLKLRRYEEALASLDRCLALTPQHGDALVCRGIALRSLNAIEDALSCCEQALVIHPESVEALINRATLLSELKRYEEAASDAEKALALAPELPYARGKLAFYRLHTCDWRELEAMRSNIAACTNAGKRAIYPFSNLALSPSSADQLACAEIYLADEIPLEPRPLWQGERYAHKRIRLAYVSADFRAHPMPQLMAGVFESHDRRQFETIAVSFGPDDNSPMRARVMSAFDRFVDVRDRTDIEIAQLIKDMETDIAVDLMRFTTGSRTSIFAARPAPLQVAYLGYPGTTGSKYFDYLIADSTVIPAEQQSQYSERIAVLPDCYLPNDSKRRIGAHMPARAEAGLPETGFVFACFNNSYKFSPEMFTIWMRLLKAVPFSVLWLPDNNPAAVRNLRHEAEARAIAPERLVFAPYLASTEEHLARLSLADLFLDTLPFNAHTTACDALWAGVPVITCQGQTFAGRVAASLLHAIGLRELITRSPGEYEVLALHLATDPATLSDIKARLAKNRETHPLFDTARFTRNLESAFTIMWERHQQGLPLESFAAGASGPPL